MGKDFKTKMALNIVVLCMLFTCLSQSVTGEYNGGDYQPGEQQQCMERLVELEKTNKLILDSLAKLEKAVANQEGEEAKTTDTKRLVLATEGPIAFTARIDPKVIDNVHNHQTIVYSTEITNVGGGYDNTTGVFTAPLAGIYTMSCSLLADHDSTSNAKLHAAIVKNGDVLAKVFAYSESGNHRDQGSNTVFVELKQADQVWTRFTDAPHGTVGGSKFSTFSGYLLWQY